MTSLLIRPSVYDCRSCSLCETRTHIVDGAGPIEAKLMIVGEAPGEQEDKTGVPFVGKSGKLIRAVLAQNGFPDGTYYVTNTVKCRPPENRNPTQEEIRACAGWFAAEIQAVQPTVILALGKFAQTSIASLGLSDTRVIPAYHPAYILRSPRNRAKWEQEIREVCDLVRTAVGTKPMSPPVTAVEVPPLSISPGAPWHLGNLIGDDDWYAADTETDTLEEGWGNRRVAWTASNGKQAMFYEGGTLEPERFRGQHTWMHNAKYDAPLLGIDLDRYNEWDCTMLMAYVLRYPLVGLKALSPDLTGMRLRNINDILGRGKKAIPFSRALVERREEAISYAAEDAVATSRIARILEGLLDRSPDQERYYLEIEKRAVKPLYELEKRGVLVNPDALVVLGEKLQDEIDQDTAAQYHMLGCPGVKFKRSSPMQLADALIGEGYILTKMTEKTGRWMLDEKILSSLVRDYEGSGDGPATRELRIRTAEKLYSTYVTKLIHARDLQGRVHGRYNQAVTGTNRLSSSNPNLQNIPIRGAIGKTIRNTFVARPGYKFVKADASQLEVRVYAEYTREHLFVQAYTHTDHDRNGPDGACYQCDVHQQVATTLGIPRWRAKNTVFAANYGADAPKLAETAGVPVSETSSFLTRLRRDIPSLITWQQDIAAALYRQGYVTTLLGWRNYYPLFSSPIRSESKAALREAANCPIQGTGAGIIKVIMNEAERLLCPRYEAELVLTVHDELDYEVPEGNAVRFARELQELAREVASRWMKLIPFKLDVEIGDTWGGGASLATDSI